MASFEVTRAGAILAVSDFERSLAFYRDTLGLEVEAVYDEPPYATLVSGGARLSLAEQAIRRRTVRESRWLRPKTHRRRTS